MSTSPRLPFVTLFSLACAAAAVGTLSAGCAVDDRAVAVDKASVNATPPSSPGVTSAKAGTLDDGRDITRYTLVNANGLSVDLLDLGCVITAVRVPDRDGELANINLHFEEPEAYLRNPPFFGAVIGRYANRIAGGTFSLDGETYTLAKNNGPNSLHGGPNGFNKQLWSAEPVDADGGQAVRLTYTSADGEAGFPSRLDVAVVYTLTDDNELRVDYEAMNRGDKPTVLNLTQHSYWNLAGEGSGSILNHVLTVDADAYLPVDNTSIPTPEAPAPVAGTPFDFTSPTPIGQRNGDVPGGGYDHSFVINGEPGTLRRAARLEDPESGRVMIVETTEPGVQLYVGVFLDGSDGNGGYERFGGVCLETQHYPDTPNRPDFPSVRLDAGETYRSTTLHRFEVAPPAE